MKTKHYIEHTAVDEEVPTAPLKQLLASVETRLRYNSNKDNDDRALTPSPSSAPRYFESSTLLAGNYNINYLFVRPANLEPSKLHNLYCRLKKDLMKMEKITKLTLLNKVRKVCVYQSNVCKLITNINKHWAKANSMGHCLPEMLKVKTLIDQARSIMLRYRQIANSNLFAWIMEANGSQQQLLVGRMRCHRTRCAGGTAII
ncbi:uncharacterized protein UDID_18518 [Ustilago sp. UG-2017a]|nr:uncharacterized protein UDID_18518 [Ustilago sp. UG-2017a]